MDNPLVSVVMPVFNAETFISQAIESILNQSYQNWELIIVNDGSTDNSMEIVRSYPSNKIRVVNFNENRGIVEARNAALDAAQGEFIAVMDADDIALPHRLKTQVAYFLKHPECILQGSDSQLIDTAGRIVGKVCRTVDNNKISELLLFCNYFTNSSVMMRKTSVRYHKKYRLSQDYHYATEMDKLGLLANLNEVLVQYRVYENSSSESNKPLQTQLVKDILHKQLQRLHLEPSSEELELHSRLVSGPYASSEPEIHKIAQWLHKVVEAANSVENTFRPEVVRYFARLFLLRHLYHAKLGWRGLKYYLKSGFYSFNLQFWKQEVKLLYATLTKPIG